ncbi:MAG: type III-B CRISPR module-associated Cmr3 family protein, partial [Methylocella sp.]
MRAVYADAVGWRFEGTQTSDTLIQAVRLHGVLLARYLLEPKIPAPGRIEAFFPKPADAIYLAESGQNAKLHRLVPQIQGWPAKDSGCDLPEGLHPVLLESGDKGKPAQGPDFWSIDSIMCWLSGVKMDLIKPSDLGVSRPQPDQRVHVVIKPEGLVAEEGGLFESAGIDFGPARTRRRFIRGRTSPINTVYW